MVKTIGAFSSLFLATLLLLVGSGLFNTYLGLRLTASSVSEVWVGAIIAAYYIGLVFGARVGHKLIIRVGHIRAYAATAALVTVTVLIQALIDILVLWMALRFVAGIAMVTQFIVLESWLNEQTENRLRGRVFAFYMVFSSMGTVLGQLSVSLFPRLDASPLMFVALCSAACLIPVAVTRRVHHAVQVPVPLHYRYYIARVPITLTVMFMAGMMSGAFYGLAPVYGVAQGMNTGQVAVFVAAAVASGLVFQWPIGWLADRISRVGLIRFNAMLLAIFTLPLWGWWPLPYPVLVVFSCMFGIILFTLYPVAAAFANDNVEPERRVGLSAIMYMVYGLGAGVGPLLVGFLMRELQAGVFFVFVTACAVFLVVFVRPQRVKGTHLSEDAPTGFVPMPESSQNQNVVPALDPRVDIEKDISFTQPPEGLPGAEAEQMPAAEIETAAANDLSPAPAPAAGADVGTAPADAAAADSARVAGSVEAEVDSDAVGPEVTAGSDAAGSAAADMGANGAPQAGTVQDSAEVGEPGSPAASPTSAEAISSMSAEAGTAEPAIEIVQPPEPPSGVRPSDLRVIAAAEGLAPAADAEQQSAPSAGDSATQAATDEGDAETQAASNPPEPRPEPEDGATDGAATARAADGTKRPAE